MNEVLVSTIGGLLAFWLWGTSDWLVSKNSKHYDSYEVNMAARVAGLVTALVLFALNYRHITGISQILPFVVVGLLFVLAFNCMAKALTEGSVGVIVPIISANPLITLILALIFGGSILSGGQIISTLVISGGILILSYQKNANKIPLKVLHRDTIYALMAAILWGLAFYIVNQTVAGVPWELVYGTIGIAGFIFTLILFLFRYRKASMPKLKKVMSNRVGLIIGALQAAGSLAFFYTAGRVGNILILVVISAGAPLAASGLSALFDHEKVGYLKRIGAIVVVCGIVLLNVIT